jgi:hypothetical protein
VDDVQRAAGFLLKSYDAAEIVSLLHEARRNPASQALFPSLNLSLNASNGLIERPAPAHSEPAPQAFSLVGAIRQLCGRRTKRASGSAA